MADHEDDLDLAKLWKEFTTADAVANCDLSIARRKMLEILADPNSVRKLHEGYLPLFEFEVRVRWYDPNLTDG